MTNLIINKLVNDFKCNNCKLVNWKEWWKLNDKYYCKKCWDKILLSKNLNARNWIKAKNKRAK